MQRADRSLHVSLSLTFGTAERLALSTNTAGQHPSQAGPRRPVASSISQPEARKRIAAEKAVGDTAVPTASVDTYAKMTEAELRRAIRSRDAQIEQLQSALKVASKSNELLSKANETLTKSVDRLTTVVSAGRPAESFPSLPSSRVPKGPSPDGPTGTASSNVQAQRTTERTFASIAQASKEAPLRSLEAERRARLAAMQPMSAAARQQHKARCATPSSAYAQCYIKNASMRISVIRSNLAFMGVPVDVIHNIACPTPYAIELTYLKEKEEVLLAEIRKAGFRLLPNFDPSRPARADATTELKERVRAQYIERMAGEIMSAHQNGARGLAEYFKQLVAVLQEKDAQPPSRSSSSSSSFPSSTAGPAPKRAAPPAAATPQQPPATTASATTASSSAATSADMDHDHGEPGSGEDSPPIISAGSEAAN
ncbi:hypothetical protein V8E36_002887 [Tilletia maclaganii]